MFGLKGRLSLTRHVVAHPKSQFVLLYRSNRYMHVNGVSNSYDFVFCCMNSVWPWHGYGSTETILIM